MPGAHILTKDFNVMGDTFPNDTTIPPFMVSTTRGFLPRQEPLIELPSEFAPLESLLQRLPIKTSSGSPGLLAEGRLGEVVDKEFPNLISEVKKYQSNQVVLNALYRDYSFLASSYLLEPCHHEFLATGSYGLARSVLPACISVPIVEVARLTGEYDPAKLTHLELKFNKINIIGFQPFMEYAGSYALFNYRLLKPEEGLHYDNLAIIRAFEHGLDRESSEAGFILVHVDMVQHSGGLIDGAVKSIKACKGKSDHELFRDGLRQVLGTLRIINAKMEQMWSKSKPGDYTSFRTFIFGITSQSMFPNGVIYEGVSETPLSFRGESGANDSMIPLCDNLLQIAMPETPLTKILEDFRQYRPGNHREFLEWVKQSADTAGVKNFALTDPQSAVLYLLCLDQVRDFRWRHWCFTREYILKKTSHPTATGGSPIVRWLPNQLQTVLKLETEVIKKLESMNHVTKEVEPVRELVARQIEKLESEVKKFCEERKA